jgi:hypothetical protein
MNGHLEIVMHMFHIIFVLYQRQKQHHHQQQQQQQSTRCLGVNASPAGIRLTSVMLTLAFMPGTLST